MHSTRDLPKLWQPRRSLLALAGVLACEASPGAGEDDGASTGTTPPVSSSESSTTGAEGSSSTTAPADTSTSTVPPDPTTSEDSSTTLVDPTISFDMGSIPDTPIDEDPGCNAVDFLFVIDNSGSMGPYQANLIANFPTFAAGILKTLDSVTSYHVGVTTTDAYTANIAGCQQIGSLVVRTGGSQSSNMMCGPYAEGFNFMTEEEPDLGMSFACAGQIGTSGDSIERPMDAVTAAVGGTLDGPGLCNEGFIREDALLVIVVITDEYDGPGDTEGGSSAGDPATWYDAVITAKNDIPENAVAMALVNYQGGPCPPPDDYSDGVHMVTWVEMFEENGFLGGICEPDYGPLFTEATAVIEEACNNFIPPN